MSTSTELQLATCKPGGQRSGRARVPGGLPGAVPLSQPSPHLPAPPALSHRVQPPRALKGGHSHTQGPGLTGAHSPASSPQTASVTQSTCRWWLNVSLSRLVTAERPQQQPPLPPLSAARGLQASEVHLRTNEAGRHSSRGPAPGSPGRGAGGLGPPQDRALRGAGPQERLNPPSVSQRELTGPEAGRAAVGTPKKTPVGRGGQVRWGETEGG